MRSPLRLPGALLLALSLSLASGCTSKGPGPQPSLPTADLVVPPKPVLTVEAVASGESADLDRHNSAIEAWGDSMAKQIGRLCRAAAHVGLPHPECPPTS